MFSINLHRSQSAFFRRSQLAKIQVSSGMVLISDGISRWVQFERTPTQLQHFVPGLPSRGYVCQTKVCWHVGWVHG